MIADDYKGLFRRTLLSGRFNLLLGAGASLTSINKLGANLPSGDALRKQMCLKAGLGDNSTLTRASKHIGSNDLRNILVEQFTVADPGHELIDLLRYPWNRVFTLNVDDAIEVAHSRCHEKNQTTLESLHFNDSFVENKNPNVLQVVHLHGSISRTTDPFVFSYGQYAELTSKPNIWMSLLSQNLATEPFIVIGTALNEPDLEHYLSFRTARTTREDWGPSLFIEPFPDGGTSKDCLQHQLHLVPNKLSEFVDWLTNEIQHPPKAIERLIPGISGLFSSPPDQTSLQLFLEDFEYLSPAAVSTPDLGSPFFFGSLPTWTDISVHYDIDRQDSVEVAALVRRALKKAAESASKTGRKRAIVVEGDPGDGKSTLLRRVAFDLARDAVPVFVAKGKGKIEISSAAHCLERLAKQPVIVVDGLAERSRDLLDLCGVLKSDLVVLSAERKHRMGYVTSILPDDFPDSHALSHFNRDERLKLIGSYSTRGFLANKDAVSNPARFEDRLKNDAAAVAVCRLLNDFRPLASIISDVWADATSEMREAYLPAAVAYMCRQQGVRYQVLQACVPRRIGLKSFMTPSIPLPLALNPMSPDFVVPGNGTLGEQLVRWLSQNDSTGAVYGACLALGKALAPWVNLENIRLRPPEAQLVARLLNADELIVPLLGDTADDLFAELEPEWSWHSQFWAQRALAIRQIDLTRAIQYARHAHSLEPNHPSPATTLATLLFQASQEHGSPTFDEAFETALGSIRESTRRRWQQEHGFVILFSAVTYHLEHGRALTGAQKGEVRTLLVTKSWPNGARGASAEKLAAHLNNLI